MMKRVPGSIRLAMPKKQMAIPPNAIKPQRPSKRGRESHDENFPDIGFAPGFTVDSRYRVSYTALVRAHLFIELPQPLPSVDAAVRQHYGVALDNTLCVMSVWNIPSEVVEFSAADGTDSCS